MVWKMWMCDTIARRYFIAAHENVFNAADWIRCQISPYTFYTFVWNGDGIFGRENDLDLKWNVFQYGGSPQNITSWNYINEFYSNRLF